MKHDFWKKKSVLITGLNGFKGSWLGLSLLNFGAKVQGIGIDPQWGPTIFSQYGRELGPLPYQKIDVRESKKLQAYFSENNFDVVFHLAAQPLVIDSYLDPLTTIHSNVVGTANLLESIRLLKKRPRVVVNVTSDKVYENEDHVCSFRETDKLGGKDPYSASKACSEIVTKSYKLSFLSDTRIATGRAGNVIGGGDWSENRIVPDIVRALLKKTVPEIRNPLAVRPWQHVLEPLSGYIQLAEKLYQSDEFEGSWNFGPALDRPFTVGDVYCEVLKNWDAKISAKYSLENKKRKSGPSTKREATFLQVDSTKARTMLEWRSRLDFLKTVEFTVDWYKLYLDKPNNKLVIAKTMEQIEHYFSL